MIFNKKGFTILEAMAAMALVSVIAGGSFAALMAARRSIAAPSHREAMVFAVEEAAVYLKMVAEHGAGPDLKTALCQSDPLENGTYDITYCTNFKPDVCDKDYSFLYTVSEVEYKVVVESDPIKLKQVIFKMGCQAESL
jgi:prepilin-type N-terminal cleavage/methylation domain-containing protein